MLRFYTLAAARMRLRLGFEPQFEVIKQLHLGLAEAVEALGQLTLDRREEALHHSVDAPICQDCCGGALGGLEVCCAQPVILDKGVVDLSSDESLQATDNVFLRQPLGGAAGDVINGRLVPGSGTIMLTVVAVTAATHATDDAPCAQNRLVVLARVGAALVGCRVSGRLRARSSGGTSANRTRAR